MLEFKKSSCGYQEGRPIYEDYFYDAAIKMKKQLHSQAKDDRSEPVQKSP